MSAKWRYVGRCSGVGRVSQPVRERTADCGAVIDDALRQLEAQQFILAATGPHEAHDLCAREFVEMYVACRAAPLPPEA